MRSDGKIFATAGWDSKVRVYSAKTMKELAVLKWHRDGCYCTAFANVSSPAIDGVDATQGEQLNPSDPQQGSISEESPTSSTALTTTIPSVLQVRIQKATSTHWLAAGSKDGKISLWDIY